MVNTKKFSDFATGSLTTTTKKMAGISNTSGGENIIVDFTTEWTTSTRPSPPYDGLLGYNTTLKQYEYWDAGTSAWIQLADNAVFTSAKFIVQQPNASLPAAQALSVLSTGILKSTTSTGVLSISAPLTSIDGLTTAADEMIYTTASNTYAVTALTSFARTLLDDSSASAMRSTLGLGQAAVKDVTDNSKADVASVTGSFTIGHVLLAADASGTVKDGGSPAGMGTVLEVDTGTGLTGGPITTTGTISLDVPVSLANGGTNASLTAANGAVPYSSATALALLAPGTSGQLLQSGGSGAPNWTTATYPTTTTINQFLYSSSSNVVAGFPSAQGAVMVTDGVSAPEWLANPSAANKMLLSTNGGAPFWSTGAIPTSAGSAGTILRSNGTDWVASTATFADTYAVSTLLYAGSSNAVSGLAAVNSAALVSTSSGVPTWAAMTDGKIIIGVTGGTPVAASVGSGSGILVGLGAGSMSVALASVADQRILANISGGSAAPSANTLTGIIDACIGATQGDILYRNATVWTVLAPGTDGQFLQTKGAAANPQWTTSATVTPAALSKADDTNVTLTLTGTPTTALLQATTITAGWTGQLGLTRGGTAASLTASNGGIVYSGASALAILAGTATAGLALLSGSSTTPSWSATAPLLVGSLGANVLTWLQTPTSANLATAVATSSTGSGALVFGTSPRITTSLLDTNGNTWIGQTATGSAVNYVNVANQAASSPPSISALGNDTNISLVLNSKGTGGVPIKGFADASNASAGYVGEFVSSVILAASGVVLANNTVHDVTSISLTAGDWDVWGNVTFVSNTGTCSYAEGWISSTSSTAPNPALYAQSTSISTASNDGFTVPQLRFSISSTTTIYLSALAGFTVALKVCGGLYARRVR